MSGEAFPCHKTTDAEMEMTSKSQHCAGSLILHKKTGAGHAAMWFGERHGLIDLSNLDMDCPDVFDDWDAMREFQEVKQKK